LISRSVERTTKGAEMAEQTGAALEDMNENIRSVLQSVREIGQLHGEQVALVTDLSGRMVTVNELKSETEQVADRGANLSHSMQDQAQGLLERIAQFKIGATRHEPHSDTKPVSAAAE